MSQDRLRFEFSPNIALNVRDRARAVEFYREVLGIHLEKEHPDPECGVEMKLGPITLWVDGVDPERAAEAGRAFFEFKVDDLNDARATLLAAGCQAGRRTSIGQMFTDPFGMGFHVYPRS